MERFKINSQLPKLRIWSCKTDLSICNQTLTGSLENSIDRGSIFDLLLRRNEIRIGVLIAVHWPVNNVDEFDGVPQFFVQTGPIRNDTNRTFYN